MDKTDKQIIVFLFLMFAVCFLFDFMETHAPQPTQIEQLQTQVEQLEAQVETLNARVEKNDDIVNRWLEVGSWGG